MTPQDITATKERLEQEASALADVSTPDPSANGQISAARRHLARAAEALSNAAHHLMTSSKSEIESQSDE